MRLVQDWFLVILFLIKGKKPAAKPVIEMGTQQNTDIDYDWLPKETTTEFGMLWFINKLVTCPEHEFFIISNTYIETDFIPGESLATPVMDPCCHIL